MTNTDTPVPREPLFSHFNHAIMTVRSYSRHFETEVARPSLQAFLNFYEERPIFAIFLAILTGLSWFPIVAFTTASAVILVCFVLVGLVTSLSAAFVVILGLSIALISALIASVIVAAIMTNLCFGVYLAFRLLTFVRQKGVVEGFASWIHEIWGYVDTIGAITLPFLNNGIHLVTPAVSQYQPSEQSVEDSDSEKKVEGPN